MQRKCLRDDMDLDGVLKVARASEIRNQQAAIMEGEVKLEVNKIHKPGKLVVNILKNQVTLNRKS